VFRRHVAVFALALAAPHGAPAIQARDIAGETDAGRMHAIAAYGRLPLIFERVADAGGARARFIGRSGDYGVEVSAHGVRIAGPGVSASGSDTAALALGIRFVGADGDAHVEGIDVQETRLHRFGNGEPSVDIPTYGRVRVASAYPNVDILFYGHGRRLEYDVVVAPGGDPSALALRPDRNTVLSLLPGGDLHASAGARSLTLHRPVAYQDFDGRRIAVDSEFVLDDAGDVRIQVGAYDVARALVIDPVISYATYLGGTSFDQGTAIATDASGNAYVTGYTFSTDFPLLSAYDRSLGRNGDVDVFVSKLNAAGSALLWSTYLGGAGSVDTAVGIAVDAAGNAYITGRTASDNFPVTASAWQRPVVGGGSFVTKLGPAGNTLVYSTYVASATSNAIAVDRNGNAYIAGSATGSFVTTPGAFQPTAATSGSTGFVLKLNPMGSAPIYSTFLGGSAGEQALTVAVDVDGNAYVGGWTSSGDFPVVKAFQPAPRGQKDGFVAKLDAGGTRLLYATRLGGSLDDSVNAIAVDGRGNAYVAGETYSSNFPSKGGFQPVKAGARLINSSVGSAFVAKIAPAGNALIYSSFLGGEVCTTMCQVVLGAQPQYAADAAYGLAVDASGHAYVTGIARSYTFPLVDSTSTPKRQDNEDSAFVAQVGQAGSTLLWSTFLRTGYDYSDSGLTRLPRDAATAVAVDPNGAAYVTGDADTGSRFQPTAGAFQTTNTNNQGAIVVKFAATPAMTLTTSSSRIDAQAPLTLTATMAGPPATGDVVFTNGMGWTGTAPLVANKATLTTALPIGIHSLSALVRASGVVADTPIVQQIVDIPLACTP
jgi:hypothetical protein